MKRLYPIFFLLVVGLVLSACSDTNDRGVIVDKPGLFGVIVPPTPTPAAQPAPATNA